MDNRRIDWIDHVRGLCILLVVMLYATGWIADATGREGWLHRVVQAWAVSRGFAGPLLPLLAFAFAGIAALVAGGALMAKHRWSEPLRYCGANSLVIYAAFFAPALAARAVLSRQALVTDGGTLALATTAAGVLGALALHWTVRGTRLRFLFERPSWLRLAGAGVRPERMQAAVRTSR